MPYQNNFLQELVAFIQIELNNASPILDEYQHAPYDLSIDYLGRTDKQADGKIIAWDFIVARLYPCKPR